MSSQTIVTGQHRFKYFKRPIMPRVSAVAPQVLLAPTEVEDPLVPIENKVESVVKDVEVQTMYRDSEAQTNPYAPEYHPIPGKDPEILLFKNLSYENALPLGEKEIELIEYARYKREMESSLPPFTDEASLNLRKRLMEQQELREFRMREKEMDKAREEKLKTLEQALRDREESNEFMTSQRLESIRLLRMEEREKVLHKIRNKRIKALRRLAHQRNIADPVLTGESRGDIIDNYFDKGSTSFAPIKREGVTHVVDSTNFDVASRTLPLDTIGNILSLEYSIPRKLVDNQFSKTTPLVNPGTAASKGVAADRLSSAAQRAVRTTKRDVEEMHLLLQTRKREAQTAALAARQAAVASERAASSAAAAAAAATTTTTDAAAADAPHDGAAATAASPSPHARKNKGRPSTPDLTLNRGNLLQNGVDQSADTMENDSELVHDLDFAAAVVLLQRLIRGRAVQNIMFEGKHRRRELIQELKRADEELANEQEQDAVSLEAELRAQRETILREVTVDAIGGAAASNVLVAYSQEQVGRSVCVETMLRCVCFFLSEFHVNPCFDQAVDGLSTHQSTMI
jgi:hypothetical protein